MKVMKIAPWYSIHSIRPLNWLLKYGHEVIFVGSKDPNPESRERYRFIPYPFARGARVYRKILGPKRGDRVVDWMLASLLHRIWRGARPDIVHVHYVDQCAYHCAKGGLSPLLLTVWGSDINQHFYPMLKRR